MNCSRALSSCLCLLFFGFHVPARAETFDVRTGQRQLFLDDVGIQKTSLKKTMHRPVKRGAVIRHPDPRQTVQTRTAPVWDPQDKLFKIWLTSGLYASSPDGLHWAVEPYDGPNLVVIDPHDPDPSRRFKSVIGAEGFFVSADGKEWTQLDLPAIPSHDEYNFSYNSKERLFIHTVKRTGPYGRSVALATSSDFQKWTDHGLIFHADIKDQESGIARIKARLNKPHLQQTEYNTPEHYSIQIYNMGMFLYEGVFIGLPSIYHHTGKVPPDWPGFKKLHLSPEIVALTKVHGDYTGFYTIQLISSRDMRNWKRQGGRQPFIETSPLGAGAYDLQTIIGPSEPVDRGDELWFYYTGIKQYAFVTSGGTAGYDDYFPDAGAICLAVLRKDGFVSLDAGEGGGDLTTRWFTLPAGKLHVNARCGRNGHLQATLVDSSGGVLAVSESIAGDHLQGRLQWKTGDPSLATGKNVRLQFQLRNTSFYSYWFK